MTAWHGLEARVRRQWALLSFTRSIPIQGDGTAAFQTNFRLTFLTFFFLFLFFSFFFFSFSFSSAQFLQKVNPSLFLSRAAIYVSEASLCLFAWKRESMVIIFLYLRFSRLGVAFRTEQGVGNLFRKIGLRFENIEKGWKIFLPKIWILETPPCGRNCFRPRN